MLSAMKVAVHLPDFIPWAGFWSKYLEADTFIFALGTHYNPKPTYFNRVNIAGRRVTIPVVSSGFGVQISDMVYRGEDLQRVHDLIRTTLLYARYGSRVEAVCNVLEEAARKPQGFLVDLNMKLIRVIATLLGAEAKVIIDVRKQAGASMEEKVFDIVARNVSNGIYLRGMNSGISAIPYRYSARFALAHPVQSQVIYPGTVLQILAREKDPVDVIQSAFRWETETFEEEVTV